MKYYYYLYYSEQKCFYFKEKTIIIDSLNIEFHIDNYQSYFIIINLNFALILVIIKSFVQTKELNFINW